MKRPSVFYVTENGTTRYGMTRSYGGLAGIILRLLTHATDGYGISIPYFERLKPMKEISEDEFQTYADHPETAMISTALPKLMWIKMFCELMRTGRKNVLIVNTTAASFGCRQLR